MTMQPRTWACTGRPRPLALWAAGRPFAWLDDEITDADQRWVAAHHPQPAPLHEIDPYQGLTDADLAAVRQWLEHLDDTIDR